MDKGLAPLTSPNYSQFLGEPMLEFLSNIAQFTLQSAVIVAAILIIIAFIASLVSKEKTNTEIKVKSLNKKLNSHRQAVLQKKLDKKSFKNFLKKEKNKNKATENEFTQPILYVLHFDGDIKASATEQLRQEISSVLMCAETKDEILLILESPGGMVHGYGLAASQLQRIKDKKIPLTICVDKVAASGGYMMAALADKIICAPYAIIGSIGVVASVPNFNKLLKKNNIDYLEITAGEYKRTITPLGEITDVGLTKFKEQIEGIHDLFKNHVKKLRPQLDLSKVATGEYWYGLQAKDLELVDEIGTSDDYLLNRFETHKIFEVSFSAKKTLKDKINESLASTIETLLFKFYSLFSQNIFR